MGYCSVGHGNRLPGCCFGPNASCTPPGLKFVNGFGSKNAISSYAPAPSVAPQGSSKPLFGQCSLALASRCRVYCVFFCCYGDEVPHSSSAYYFGSLSPWVLFPYTNVTMWTRAGLAADPSPHLEHVVVYQIGTQCGLERDSLRTLVHI